MKSLLVLVVVSSFGCVVGSVKSPAVAAPTNAYAEDRFDIAAPVVVKEQAQAAWQEDFF